jgi:hypothetical protein
MDMGPESNRRRFKARWQQYYPSDPIVSAETGRQGAYLTKDATEISDLVGQPPFSEAFEVGQDATTTKNRVRCGSEHFRMVCTGELRPSQTKQFIQWHDLTEATSKSAYGWICYTQKTKLAIQISTATRISLSARPRQASSHTRSKPVVYCDRVPMGLSQKDRNERTEQDLQPPVLMPEYVLDLHYLRLAAEI